MVIITALKKEDVCICSTCTVSDCQADFDVDNVQHRELVKFHGV